MRATSDAASDDDAMLLAFAEVLKAEEVPRIAKKALEDETIRLAA